MLTHNHILSKSSHLCPCTSKRKSIAALFCRVASLTSLTLGNKPLNAREVALVCSLNQQPAIYSLSIFTRPCEAMRAEGTEPSGIRLEICGGSQADRIEARTWNYTWHTLSQQTLPGYYHGHCKSAQAKTARAHINSETNWKVHMFSMQLNFVGGKNTIK